MSFNEYVKTLKAKKPLRILHLDTKLPYAFDLNWDCKTPADIIQFNLLENRHVQQLLVEHGYDLQKFLNDNK